MRGFLCHISLIRNPDFSTLCFGIFISSFLDVLLWRDLTSAGLSRPLLSSFTVRYDVSIYWERAGCSIVARKQRYRLPSVEWKSGVLKWKQADSQVIRLSHLPRLPCIYLPYCLPIKISASPYLHPYLEPLSLSKNGREQKTMHIYPIVTQAPLGLKFPLSSSCFFHGTVRSARFFTVLASVISCTSVHLALRARMGGQWEAEVCVGGCSLSGWLNILVKESDESFLHSSLVFHASFLTSELGASFVRILYPEQGPCCTTTHPARGWPSSALFLRAAGRCGKQRSRADG